MHVSCLVVKHGSRILIDKCGPRVLAWPKAKRGFRVLIVKRGPRILADKCVLDERESRIKNVGLSLAFTICRIDYNYRVFS